jgi:MSHA pilin protein MshD
MCIPERLRTSRRFCSSVDGITLVELLVFIVIVSVALVGILSVYGTVTRRSADPLIVKQMTAIAEALLEEVELMPFTFCDPDDPNAATAASIASCTTVEGMGAEAGETRGNATTPLDNVNDYAGLIINPVTDISGNAFPGVAGYSASIAVTQTALGVIAASEALLIDVTVNGPGGQSFTLSGFRTRYAPRATP